MEECSTKRHIPFSFKHFALFLRNPSVCERVSLYLPSPIQEKEIMKRGLIIAASILTSLSSAAQDFSKYTPGTMGEGVVYYLPKTEIELEVVATKVTYTPGELCQYANRYLRMTNISAQPETYWEIKSIKAKAIGIPDPDNAYVVKLKDKSAASQVELTNDGIIKAINTTSPIEKTPATPITNTAKKRIDPRSFMTEEILSTASTAKMAELVAKEIYNIRESKNSLTRGQADYMPKDGAALKLMLDNLDEQEQAMMQMFAGITNREDKTLTIRVTPTEDIKDKVAFRFSKKLGVVSDENLAGEPIYLSVTNQETLPPADQKAKDKRKVDGVIYNIPGKALVTVASPTKRYFKGELLITQFGTTEVLVDNLFNKKINTRVLFDPNNGKIVKIDKD